MTEKKDEETLAKIAAVLMVGLGVALWLRKPEKPNRVEANLEDRVNGLHRTRKWWRNPSHVVHAITLIALVLGAGFQVWLNRPVIDLLLKAKRSRSTIHPRRRQLFCSTSSP
jgi:hypothetical protein